MNNVQVITKKDINKSFVRWWMHGQDAWNYEKMQGLGYAYSMIPALKKIYKDDEDGLQKAVKNHMQFFNCGFYTATLIMGATIGIEEEKKQDGEEVVTAIKTGLMGPLAGVSDTLFQAIIKTIFGAIAAYMAMEGSSVGIWLWIIANIVKIVISFQFMHVGYKQGVKLVTTMGSQLKKITECANILGLTVIGALIPSVIKANVPYVFKSGSVSLEIQSILDKVMPSLLPVLIVCVIYWILGKKSMNTTKAVLILIAIAIGCSFLGILG
ncbi:PTS system mannose/fructose/sorbose family transporter subunit IID [Amedibacillus sp. YH-ame10]